MHVWTERLFYGLWNFPISEQSTWTISISQGANYSCLKTGTNHFLELMLCQYTCSKVQLSLSILVRTFNSLLLCVCLVIRQYYRLKYQVWPLNCYSRSQVNGKSYKSSVAQANMKETFSYTKLENYHLHRIIILDYVADLAKQQQQKTEQ